jgi:hypothetical protein
LENLHIPGDDDDYDDDEMILIMMMFVVLILRINVTLMTVLTDCGGNVVCDR